MSKINKKLLEETLRAREAALSYSMHDKFRKKIRKLIKQAYSKDFFIVVDFSKHSSEKRLFVVKKSDGTILRSHHVAHGKGSDWNNTGYVQELSNENMSKKSSGGMMVTGNVYHWGKKFPNRWNPKPKLKLYGLEDTNSNVFRRAIVVHASDYVTDGYIARNGKAGRSWGCLAVDPAITESLIDLIQDGVFVYVAKD